MLLVCLCVSVLITVVSVVWLLKQSARVQMQAAAITDLAAELGATSAALVEANSRASAEHKQRVEIVECVAMIERERNMWKDKYWKAAFGHSAAQELLFAEITRLYRLCTQKGVKFKDDSRRIRTILDNYANENLPDTPEKRNRISAGVVAEAPAQAVESGGSNV